MNITSMSGQDLYKTLFGREVVSQWIVSDEDKDKIAPSGTQRLTDEFIYGKPYKVDPDTSSVISLFETGGKIFSYVMGLTGIKTDKEFAKHFGEIGKRLDEAYAEGKFTEEEYNELNANLTEYISYMKEKNDYWRAKREFTYDGVNVMTGDKEKDKQTMDRFFEIKKNAIDAILNKSGFCTPIEKIMEMISKYRYGDAANIINVMLAAK